MLSFEGLVSSILRQVSWFPGNARGLAKARLTVSTTLGTSPPFKREAGPGIPSIFSGKAGKGFWDATGTTHESSQLASL